MAKTFEITVYNRATGKIEDVYKLPFFDESTARSYCRGRSSDTSNAMFEEVKRVKKSKSIPIQRK